MLGRGVVDPDVGVLVGDDLGLTRGDGCFEATRLTVSDDGEVRIDHLGAHLERFVRSAQALDLPPIDLAAWHELIATSVAAWTTPGEAILRVMITRGTEHAPAAPVTGVLTIAPLDPAARAGRQGLRVVTLDRGHTADAFAGKPWLLGGVKTLSYAINVAAGREARRHGADEALFVSSDGFALEAPRAALVWLRDGVLGTTPVDGTGILASITQAAAFTGAAAEGVGTETTLLRVAALDGVDGAWLLSSGRGVAPILQLDGRPLQRADDWTVRLRRWAG